MSHTLFDGDELVGLQARREGDTGKIVVDKISVVGRQDDEVVS
jgi:hypothetical protein